MNKENSNANLFWVIGILGFIIILLISVKLGENTELVGLINFASTLTSLVLAVLAIVYAFISNSSVSQSMGKLGDASEEISNTAKEVSEAARELKEKIEAIPTKLESMEDQFGELKLLFQSTESEDERPPSKEEKEATSEIVDLFINKLAISSLVALYAFFRAFKEKKPIDFHDLFSGMQTISGYGYGLGIFVSMFAIGLLNHKKMSYKSSFIFNFNEKLAKLVENDFNNIVDAAFKKYVENVGSEKGELTRNRFNSDIKSIDVYFSVDRD